MANIRIKDLPAAVSPASTVETAIDDGLNTLRVAAADFVAAGRPLASQAEAEAGTNPAKAMTPLTVAQAIAAQGSNQFASSAQGDLADTAVQPGDLGSAALEDVTAFATAAQGVTADSAVQPGDLAAVATTGNMDDMSDGASKVAMTVAERGKLQSVIPEFATKALAEADTPATAAPFVKTAFLDTNQTQGSGALYGDPSTTDPGTPDVLEQSAGGVPHFYIMKSDTIKVRSLSSNDDTAIAAALQIAGSRPIDFGTGTYTLTAPLSATLTSDLIIRGDDARIDFDSGGVQKQTALILDMGGTKRLVDIEGITLDAGAICNRGLHIRNNAATMADANIARIRLHAGVRNIRRMNTLVGGDALLIEGGYSEVDLSGSVVEKAALPTGQGTPGTIGVRSVGITQGAANTYARKVIMIGGKIGSAYSEDKTYTTDQDGLAYFTPFSAFPGVYLPSELLVQGVTFENNFGRSIKSRAFANSITDNLFMRNDGLSVPASDPEIDFQISGGNVSRNEIVYEGYVPALFVGSSATGAVDKSALTAENNTARISSGLTLPIFSQTFPNGNSVGKTKIAGNKIFGTVMHLHQALCNGDRNFQTVENNYVKEFAPSTLSGMTGEYAAIVVRTSGATTPYLAYITAFGNVYDGANAVALVRDSVAGTGMTSIVNAYNNVGFLDDKARRPNAGGAKTDQIARLGRIGPSMEVGAQGQTGYFRVQTLTIAAASTGKFTVRTGVGSVLLLTAGSGPQAGALVGVGATMVSMVAGTSWGIGAVADPGTGTFRAWRSAGDEITISNTSGGTVYFTVFEFCPG
ncbi:hypothetical protein [Mesorhizobium sp. BE184]|uniref:hypothetical protein n=1 Tax=Mesorhizobium sp. BE184 TaxID=2817714 RepID=UPI00285BCCA6|nr:hypothetical protein [Mesorhizobium sp. BE184]MDR7032441.1 hypothetical protein [Mesorhizobium sp. BE184]